MKDETWIDKIADKIIDVIDERIKKPGESYSTVAQVIKVDKTKGTAWVAIPGGNPETPAALSIDCKAGDTVQVYVSGHKATLTGNMTAPPTDDTTAIEVKEEVKRVGKTVDFYVTEQGVIKEEAENAQETADNAMTAANGKNKLYFASTAPSGGTYNVGDTWFDTANDNAIYHWDGSQWQAALLGDDALDTFSANHIVAGSIDASQVTISNLDASKITSGYLNAARIEAGSLSIGKTSGLQAALDNAGAANSYVTTISGKTGIAVHMANDTSNYALMNSNGLEVYKSSAKVASFGTTAVIGYSDGRHVELSNGYLYFYDNTSNLGNIGIVNNSLRFYQNPYCYIQFSDANDTISLISDDIFFSGKLFEIVTAESSTTTVNAGSGGHFYCTGNNTTSPLYMPIAVVGVTSNHTFSGVISHVALTRNGISTVGADVDLINVSNSNQSFKVTAKILCTRIQSTYLV